MPRYTRPRTSDLLGLTQDRYQELKRLNPFWRDEDPDPLLCEAYPHPHCHDSGIRRSRHGFHQLPPRFRVVNDLDTAIYDEPVISGSPAQDWGLRRTRETLHEAIQRMRDRYSPSNVWTIRQEICYDFFLHVVSVICVWFAACVIITLTEKVLSYFFCHRRPANEDQLIQRFRETYPIALPVEIPLNPETLLGKLPNGKFLSPTEVEFTLQCLQQHARRCKTGHCAACILLCTTGRFSVTPPPVPGRDAPDVVNLLPPHYSSALEKLPYPSYNPRDFNLNLHCTIPYQPLFGERDAQQDYYVTYLHHVRNRVRLVLRQTRHLHRHQRGLPTVHPFAKNVGQLIYQLQLITVNIYNASRYLQHSIGLPGMKLFPHPATLDNGKARRRHHQKVLCSILQDLYRNVHYLEAYVIAIGSRWIPRERNWQNYARPPFQVPFTKPRVVDHLLYSAQRLYQQKP